MSRDTSTPQTAVARVNGNPISRFLLDTVLTDVLGHYKKQGGVVPPDVREQLRKKVLDQLIERELVYQECLRRAYPVDELDVQTQMRELAEPFGGEVGLTIVLTRRGVSLDEVRNGIRRDLLIDGFLENVIHTDLEVRPDDVRRYFDEHRERFSVKERLEVRHISVAVPAGSTQAERDEARELIDAIRERIATGEEFAKVGQEAAEEDGGRVQAGNLEAVERGTLIGALDTAVFGLSIGQTSDVIESPIGVHLLELLERKPARDLPFDECVPAITRVLKTERREAQTAAFVAVLQKTATIEIQDEPA